MSHSFSAPGPGRTGRAAASLLGRRALLGGAVAAGFGLVAACSPGSSGRPGQTAPKGDGGSEGYSGPAVELAFWHGLTGGDGPIMKDLTARFTKEFPKITIKQQAIAWEQYYEKLPAAVSQGKGPDIAIMHIDRVPTNAARRVIQPLDDVNDALGLGEGDYVPIAWQAGQYDGQHWSVPLDIHCAGLYYNKKTMEKVGLDPETPPTNEEEYLSALDAAKSKGVQGMWVSALSAPGLLCQTLLYQFGGQMVAKDGSALEFGSEAGIKAVEWLKMLIKEGYSPPKAAADGDVVSFQNDKSLFMFNGSWMVTPLNDVKKLEWGAAIVPNIGGTDAVSVRLAPDGVAGQPGRCGREPVEGGPGIPELAVQALSRLGRRRPGSGSQRRPRGSQVRREGSGGRVRQAAGLHQLHPADPRHHRLPGGLGTGGQRGDARSEGHRDRIG